MYQGHSQYFKKPPSIHGFHAHKFNIATIPPSFSTRILFLFYFISLFVSMFHILIFFFIFHPYLGERYDFVINADQPVGAYWIQARGLGECGVRRVQQLGILRYARGPYQPTTNAPTYDVGLPQGVVSIILIAFAFACVYSFIFQNHPNKSAIFLFTDLQPIHIYISETVSFSIILF